MFNFYFDYDYDEAKTEETEEWWKDPSDNELIEQAQKEAHDQTMEVNTWANIAFGHGSNEF